jgi:tRNA U38,U39,U40 pseudouridine synthase TruA
LNVNQTETQKTNLENETIQINKDINEIDFRSNWKMIRSIVSSYVKVSRELMESNEIIKNEILRKTIENDIEEMLYEIYNVSDIKELKEVVEKEYIKKKKVTVDNIDYI